MKKKLSVVSVMLMITVLVTCVLGGSVFASTRSVANLNEYDQLEMPIIAINTPSDSAISSNEVYTNAKISVINDEGNYEMTDMGVSIKLRGKSSMHADKKSYKIKFDKKQNLLDIGDGKGKPWALIANYYDGSLLRNFTAHRLANMLTGISYSPNIRSVELYLNGEYQGVYLLCEDVNVNNNRVAITEEPDEVENNGYLVEMSRYAKDNKFEVDMASYEIKSNLSETESIKEKQIAYISGYINKSYSVLKNGKQKEVEKYINIDSLVDIYIGNEIVKNVDAGWDSFYMYKDANGKLCFGPMWDFDLALGNANCVKGFDSWSGVNPFHILNVNANSNPWFCHALSSKWFRKLVTKRWNKLKDEINDLPNIVRNEAKSNYMAYCRNFEKWDVLGRQVYIEPAKIASLKTFKGHYMYLSSWLGNRIKWLTKYYNSKDFEKGVFLNEDGTSLSELCNLAELSSILPLANAHGVKMTFEMIPYTGMSMSIENGGSESWHTMIIASGFMLEEETEYVLSFDYKCSEDRLLSFGIQQNYEPWSPYYLGELNATNKLQHYKTTFKASKNESNAVLVFNLGGDTFNGTVVTIDKISLVKKSAEPNNKCKKLKK